MVERITRIAASDVHLEVVPGEARQEVMVPFTDIHEIQLQPKERLKYRTILMFGAPGSGKGTHGKILGTIPGFLSLQLRRRFPQPAAPTSRWERCLSITPAAASWCRMS